MGFLGRVSNSVRSIGRTAGSGLGSIGRFTSSLLSGAGSAAKKVAEIGNQALRLAEAIPALSKIPLVQGLVGGGRTALSAVELGGDVARAAGAAGKMLTSNFEKR